MRQRYFGGWASVEDVNSAYWEDTKPNLQDSQILMAWEESECYEGSCYVLYRDGDKLLENSSGHCSCNGFYWEPDEVSLPQLQMRLEKGDFYRGRGLGKDVEEMLKELCGVRV